MVFVLLVPRPLAAPVNPWSGALQVLDVSSQSGLPEAAQYARRAQGLPHVGPEIGETPPGVKELARLLLLLPGMERNPKFDYCPVWT